MQIRFKASLPAVHAALDVHGMDGMRVKLDVPDTDLPQAMKLVLFRGQVLDVTIQGEGAALDIPPMPKPVEGRRKSDAQRMRDVIWVEHAATGGTEDTFSDAYHTRMGKLIEGIESGEL